MDVKELRGAIIQLTGNIPEDKDSGLVVAGILLLGEFLIDTKRTADALEILARLRSDEWDRKYR